jgi:hypothetical protein
VIPGDELFEALAPEMVNTSALSRDINERIINLSKDGSESGRLRRRICGLVFLIGKLPHETGADLGVRATPEHIADLLVDDLAADNGKLRSTVGNTLESLASDGNLMRVGREYRLQTKESSEWDREFRNRQARLANDDATLQVRRDGLLYAAADRIVKTLKLNQGAAKEPRPVLVHREQSRPAGNGHAVSVWIRDGWSCGEKDVLDAARAAGSEDAVVYVFIPRQSAEDLRRRIIEAEAAEQTLNVKGSPASFEGQEARRGMESRCELAVKERDGLVTQIVANAKVFHGGGNELLQLTLEEKLREASAASLVRLFPRLKEADSAAWGAVIRRAREGADLPFQPLGHAGSTEQHPVCRQVLETIGAGKSGAEVRKVLQASPFGWPKDAVDAALIALHRAQHLSATLNGAPVQPGQLDQNKISKTEFRREQAVLSVGDRLAVRKLYNLLNVACKGGDEALRVGEFLAALATLAAAAGGPPPLPAPPSTAEIEDLNRLVGSEQLAALRAQAAEWESRIGQWTKVKAMADKRRPDWELTERLAHHAAVLVGAADARAQVEAIRNGRLLLEPTDPLVPLRGALCSLLRESVRVAAAQYQDAYAAATATFAGDENRSKLPEQDRSAILAEVGLAPAPSVVVSTDAALLASLDARPLATWEAEVHAVPGRLQFALELAARRLEPRVRTLSLERATLRSKDDVRAWLARQETRLLEALEDGPVLVN